MPKTKKPKTKKKKLREVQSVCFTIYGEDFTRLVRDVMMEGRWHVAFHLVGDGLIGISYEQTVGILNGDYVMAGNSNDGITLEPEDKQSDAYTAYRAQLAWAYGDRVHLNASNWYRPYGYVTSFGPRDLAGPDSRGHVGIEHDSPRRRGEPDNRRVAYYARNPVTDKIRYLRYSPAPTTECAVLFERCDAPPLWWKVPSNPQAALDCAFAVGKRLQEYGALVNDERTFEWSRELDDEFIGDNPLEDKADKWAGMTDRQEPLTAQQMMTQQLIADNPMLAGKAADIVDAVMGDGKEMDIPPEPEPAMQSEMGYITPDGRFWGCEYMHHPQLAFRILVHIDGMSPDDIKDEEQLADKRGWVRVQQSVVGGKPYIHIPKKPTQRQQDTLFDWCTKHNVKYPKMEDL